MTRDRKSKKKVTNEETQNFSPECEYSRIHASAKESTYTIKDRVFVHLESHPNSKPKAICDVLELPYRKYGGSVKAYRYQFRKECSRFGLPSKRRSSTHGNRFCVFSPTSCDRVSALEVGWKQSKNRNGVLYWDRHQYYGRIEWWQNGRVLVHVKKPATLARAKKLLSVAFIKTCLIFDDKIAGQFLDKVEPYSGHDVYRTPSKEKLPYMKITAYEKTHGITILLGDDSHKDSVEVHWCKPRFVEKIEALHNETLRIVSTNTKVIQDNSRKIQEFNNFMHDLISPQLVRDSKNPFSI